MAPRRADEKCGAIYEDLGHYGILDDMAAYILSAVLT
jgi:hypothetical protein